MSDRLKNDPTVDVRTGVKVENDFNRTVVVTLVDSGSGGGKPTSFGGSSASFQKKREIEELVGGVNINPYVSSELDTTSHLDGSLNKLADKYALLEDFASGGTARVSIARDRNLRRLVAIKSLKQGVEHNADLLDAFVAEAKITAQLDHPGIIPIYELSGDDGNGVHLVMKLVDGKTLREYLRNTTLNYRIRGIETFDEAMMLRKRLEIFLRVCDTIAYAHHRNVVHRDLKPENIMIGKFMEVFVMDWGIAKVISEADGPGGTKVRLAGTPRYFAPEVLRREPLDPRSDLFTLGLILQEVVTLQQAVQGKDEKDLMDKIVNGDICPIEHLYQWKIDRDLQAIIRKATAYWPNDRYQTAEDLAEDLRRYMAGLTVSAVPESGWRKFLRKLFGNGQ